MPGPLGAWEGTGVPPIVLRPVISGQWCLLESSPKGLVRWQQEPASPGGTPGQHERLGVGLAALAFSLAQSAALPHRLHGLRPLKSLPWRLPRQDPLTPAPETVLSYKGEASRGQSWDWNLDCPTSDPPLFHSTHPLQPISTPPPAPSRSLPCLSHPWCQVFITSRPNCLMPSHVSACKPVSPAPSALTTGQAELMK